MNDCKDIFSFSVKKTTTETVMFGQCDWEKSHKWFKDIFGPHHIFQIRPTDFAKNQDSLHCSATFRGDYASDEENYEVRYEQTS